MDEHATNADDWDQADFWSRRAQEPDAGDDDDPPVARHRLRVRTPVAKIVVALAGMVLIAVVGLALLPEPVSPPANSAASTRSESARPQAAIGDVLIPVPDVSPSASPASSPPAEPPASPTAAETRTQTPPAPPPARTSSPPAPPAPISPANGKIVRIVHPASGKSIGVSNGSTANGALISLSGSEGDNAQKWRLTASSAGCYHLINVKSGKALDNPDGTSVNGVQMHQWTNYSGNTNQNWCFQPIGSSRYSIRNGTSGFLLDVRGWGAAAGTPIQQWNADPAAPNSNQTWQLYAA